MKNKLSTPVVNGTFEDQPFYTILPQPPLGMMDPTWPLWRSVVALAQKRGSICGGQGDGASSTSCEEAREKYFEAARHYANALDRVYGLGRF